MLVDDEFSEREKLIEEEYKKILFKIRDSTLYGIKLEEDNIIHMIAGAYYLGKSEKADIDHILKI